MKFSIIVGSHRKKSQSGKVAEFIRHSILTKTSDDSVFMLDLGGTPLPLWDEGVWELTEQWKKVWHPTARELITSDAIIVVSPEWGGMVPAALKNFFLICGNDELAHKPALIVAVSAGTGGSYPVAELRMSSYKNNHLCYIPEHVIVRKVKDVLSDLTQPVSKEDEFIRKRLDYALNILKLYAEALKLVRASNVIDHKNFPYGM